MSKDKKAEYGLEISIPKDLENLHLPDPSLIQFYEDIENRIYWILGPIDDSLYELVKYIIAWNKEDNEKDLKVKERTPIKIIIASEGGSLEIQQTLTSVIELSKTPVYSIAIGMCASAASMIYLSCKKRYATKNATFIFHQGGASDISGTYQQIAAFMENYAKDIDNMSEFYKTHTNYEPEIIDAKLAGGDWYIDVSEAIKNGIVNKIVTDLNIFM